MRAPRLVSRDIVRIVDQPPNARVLNPCPSVSIDIPNANAANVGVDMSCVAADPHRFWFNPPVRISNKSAGAMTKRQISRIASPDLTPSQGERYVKARDVGDTDWIGDRRPEHAAPKDRLSDPTARVGRQVVRRAGPLRVEAASTAECAATLSRWVDRR